MDSGFEIARLPKENNRAGRLRRPEARRRAPLNDHLEFSSGIHHFACGFPLGQGRKIGEFFFNLRGYVSSACPEALRDSYRGRQ